MQGIAFDKAKRDLKNEGLLDEGNQLTAAGHDWTRALITRIDHTAASNWEKIRRKQEQEEAYERDDFNRVD